MRDKFESDVCFFVVHGYWVSDRGRCRSLRESGERRAVFMLHDGGASFNPPSTDGAAEIRRARVERTRGLYLWNKALFRPRFRSRLIPA